MSKVKVTAEQIADWKKKHGDIFEVTSGDLKGYVKQPDRKVISMARVVGEGEQIKTSEAILEAVWLGGDEELIKEDKYFLSISRQIDSLVEMANVTLKKI